MTRRFLLVFLVVTLLSEGRYGIMAAPANPGVQGLEALHDEASHLEFLRGILWARWEGSDAAELAKAPELAKIATLLLDPKVDPNECERAVISLLRQAYAQMPSFFDRPLWGLVLYMISI